MNEVETMLQHAHPFLDSARDNAVKSRNAVAIHGARHAAEIAAKALHLKATGTDLGRDHKVAGPLNARGLLPARFPEAKWPRFFMDHTRASYGYFEEFTPTEVQQAIDMAQTMLDAAESYPDFDFHPPRTA